MDVPPQDVITRDTVPVKVNAVVYFRVMDPEKSVVKIERYMLATSQIAQTTLRSILGQAEHHAQKEKKWDFISVAGKHRFPMSKRS